MIDAAYPKGLVDYYFGLKVQEFEGSQSFYFPDLDSKKT